MIIVAGHLELDPAERDAYLAPRAAVMRAARAAPGCLEFALTADPVDAGRVLVFERWETDEQLLAFRGGEVGDAPDLPEEPSPTGASVAKYRISAIEAP